MFVQRVELKNLSNITDEHKFSLLSFIYLSHPTLVNVLKNIVYFLSEKQKLLPGITNITLRAYFLKFRESFTTGNTFFNLDAQFFLEISIMVESITIEEYRGQTSVILDYHKKSIVFPKSQCISFVLKQERETGIEKKIFARA
jgi:hypothetical protein